MGYTSTPFSTEILRRFIDEKFGKSVAFFARRMDVEPQTVWKWLKRGRMDPEKLEKAAALFDVPIQELKMNDSAPTTIDVNARPVRAKIYRLPVHRLLPASRLGGPEDMYTVPSQPDEYRDTPAPSDECMVVQIDGDCMAPDYPSGTYVMIDFARTAGEGLVPGAPYYVQLRGDGEGKATFKRYRGPEGDAEVFDCINPDYPQVIRLTGLFNAGMGVAKVAWMAGKSKRKK